MVRVCEVEASHGVFAVECLVARLADPDSSSSITLQSHLHHSSFYGKAEQKMYIRHPSSFLSFVPCR